MFHKILVAFRTPALNAVARLCLIAVGACDSTHGPTSVRAPTVVGLTIQGTEQAIIVATGIQLTAVEVLSDTTTRPVAASWSTDNPDVAQVDSHGVITGVNAGAAAVIATTGVSS